MVSDSRESSCCGLCCLCKTLFRLILFVGFFIFSFWVVFRPHRFKAHVDTASLAHFGLADGDDTLQYNLSLDLAIRNPNKRIGIYYDRIEATALYNGSQLGSTTLPTFYQHRKNTTVLHTAFEGRAPASGTMATTFKREKGEGSFCIELRALAKIRLKVWSIKTRHYKARIGCVLKIPAPPGVYRDTACHVHY